MSRRTAGPLLVLPVAAVLVACGDAGGSADAVEDRLAAVTAAYYDGLADGDAAAVRGSLCRAERDGFDAEAITAAAPQTRTELVELRQVRIEGDTAQATAVLTSPDADDRRSTYRLQYRYEDGWTLC